MDYIENITMELLREVPDPDVRQRLQDRLLESGTIIHIKSYMKRTLMSVFSHVYPSSSFMNRTLSPKDYALNLLVAEYLLEQEYIFTASIFHTEEPNLGRPPPRFEPSSGKVDSSTYFRLKDAKDILDSLNLGMDTMIGRRVIRLYHNERRNNQSTSLLRALFQELSGRNFRSKAYSKLSAGDSATHGSTMVRKTSSAKFGSNSTSSEVHKKTQSGDANNYPLTKSPSQGDLREEWEDSGEEESLHVSDAPEKESDFIFMKDRDQKWKISNQKKAMETINQRNDQMAIINQRLMQIKMKEDELGEKEVKFKETQKQETERMARKHSDIVRAQQKLDEDFKRLNKDQLALKRLQKEVEVWHEQILRGQVDGNSKKEANIMERGEEKQSKNDLQDINGGGNDRNGTDTLHMVHSMHSLHNQAIHACQQTISELKDKNQMLQAVANEQSSRINSLTAQALALSHQLEEANAALRLISSQKEQISDFIPIQERVTVLSMPKSDENLQSFQTRQMQNEYLNEGSRKYSQSKEFSRTRKHRHSRYRRDSDESDSSTASSTTEEIIREARRRLEKLEKESNEVDRQFLFLRHKHMSDKSVISGLDFYEPSSSNRREQGSSKNDLPTVAQDIGLTSIPPFQFSQGNFSVQVADGLRETKAQCRGSAQLAPNHALKRDQSQLSQFMYSSPADDLPQPPSTPLGNEASIPVGSLYNNNTKEHNSFSFPNHSYGVNSDVNTKNQQQNSNKPKERDVPIDNGNSEPKQTFNNESRQFIQSQNDFHTKESQRNVRFEETESKRNGKKGNINEKNHLSAMKMSQSEISKGNQKTEELLQINDLETQSLVTRVDESIGNAFNNRTYGNIQNDVDPQQLPATQRVPLESHVTVSTPEDTSSPKLSVANDDGKDDENSDLW